VQLFSPGLPQVYYVGLLGGGNDMARYRASGEGRDVNRHAYSADELATALDAPLTRAQLDLVRLRSTHPAFDGTFAVTSPGGARLELAWTNGPHRAVLAADLDPAAPSYRVDVS
jgi:sucrose phosphorylase